MNRLLLALLLGLLASADAVQAAIDRRALVSRHNPHVSHLDTLSSLSLGNGEFAFTCDVTGLQTFHRLYAHGVPLGTMSQWAWHSLPNTGRYEPREVLRPFDFGRRSDAEFYSCQLKDERGKAASDYLRANPHRLHLGIVAFDGMQPADVSDVNQTLDLWNGLLVSNFRCQGSPTTVLTAVHPQRDRLEARISDPALHSVSLHFPYPTARHSDDACDWSPGLPHHVSPVPSAELPESLRAGRAAQRSEAAANTCTYRHTLDGQSYLVTLSWQHAQQPVLRGNTITLQPTQRDWVLEVEFSPSEEAVETIEPMDAMEPAAALSALSPLDASAAYWPRFWTLGGAVDMSRCTDPRAFELERRIVLSQYLTAIQCAGSTPPQETGLTYNSWFGKFHLEMIWWHQAHFALWGHPELLARTLPWYFRALPMAREIARRQGLDGARWMKMTDPSAAEAPSNTGSFLVWQQPHVIYLAELLRRSGYLDALQGSANDRRTKGRGKSAGSGVSLAGGGGQSAGVPSPLADLSVLVDETARCMASLLTLDSLGGHYTLRGCIPAQETLKAATTVNPPYELSYWHFALTLAQQWRERQGLPRLAQWDDMLRRLSPLTAKEGIYTASADSPSYPELLRRVRASSEPSPSEGGKSATAQPFEASELTGAVKLFSDHPAVLCALGVLPMPQGGAPARSKASAPGASSLLDADTMRATLGWVMSNWNWDKTWGWDFPTVCMTAVRLGEPELALEALLKDVRTNTYLPNGHNYQDSRLRCYLPGNGGLLTAVALMCAGYDGCSTPLPGFPKDGRWDVRFEGIRQMP